MISKGTPLDSIAAVFAKADTILGKQDVSNAAKIQWVKLPSA
jgi:hypothetical protein